MPFSGSVSSGNSGFSTKSVWQSACPEINMTQRSEETGTTQSRRNRDVANLEQLVRDLAGEYGTPNALMREHLDAARFYLLGSMPAEYEFSLKLAADSLPDIEDKELQARVAGFLRSQGL
jgi:hypothetical protein